MRATLVGGFLANIPRPTPAKVVALLAAVLGTVAALGLAASPASAATFSNNDGITINTSNEQCFGGVATAPEQAEPYPSEIAVSGLGSPILDVNVTVRGLSHTFPDDVGLLLVSPEGQSAILMTDSGGGVPVSGIDLTFDDAAPSGLPDNSQLVSGIYLPSVGTAEAGVALFEDPNPPDIDSCSAPGSFPSTDPADPPAGPYGSSLSVFNGSDPNGTWKLYVIDDSIGDAGSIAGWSLDISAVTSDTTAPRVSCSASPSRLKPPNHKLVAITANVEVTDEDSGPAGFTLVSVTSNQAESGLGFEDVPSDIEGWTTGTADTSGQLRAERYGSPREYKLTYEGKDVAGNTSTCEAKVTVPKGSLE